MSQSHPSLWRTHQNYGLHGTNVKNVDPKDADSSASDAYDFVDPVQQYHLNNHRGPSQKYGLPQLGVQGGV